MYSRLGLLPVAWLRLWGVGKIGAAFTPRTQAGAVVLNKVVSSIAARLPPDSSIKRDLVTTALWHLQDVAYTRLRDRGFNPGGIVDVGAYDGSWAAATRVIFGNAALLLIEARDEESARLAERCAGIPNSEFVIALLGSEPRAEVPFAIHGTGSSIFSERSNAERSWGRLSMCTLDSVTSSKPRLRNPLFLKLDVQGGELEVLKGATETLRRSEIVQLEVALLPYNEGAPTAAEVISFMDERGFAMFDIAGFVRPNGNDLVQIDVLFARKDSRLRTNFFQF